MAGEKIDAIARIFHQSRSRRAALLDLAMIASGADVRAEELPRNQDRHGPKAYHSGPQVQARRKCPRNKSRCGTKCVDLMTDERYCGSCDVRCPDEQVCTDGACSMTCGTEVCGLDDYNAGFEVCLNGTCCLPGQIQGETCLPRPLGAGPFHVVWEGGNSSGLSSPEGVAWAPDSTIWVADTANDRLLHVQRGPSQYSKGTVIGTPLTGFNGPTALAVNNDGVLFVCDADNNQIVRVDGDSRIVWSTFGNGIGRLLNPVGIALGPDGTLWIADTDNHRIVHVTQDGQGINEFGTYGTRNGEFDGPEGVAVDDAGNVFVADSGNGRIQKFTGDGDYLLKWGGRQGYEQGCTVGIGAFPILYPTGVAIGPFGYVYVADPDFGIQAFNAEGVGVSRVCTSGRGELQHALPYGPTTVSVLPNGLIVTADPGRDNIYLMDQPAFSNCLNGTCRF